MTSDYIIIDEFKHFKMQYYIKWLIKLFDKSYIYSFHLKVYKLLDMDNSRFDIDIKLFMKYTYINWLIM